jgi:antitoxin Phd
VIKVTIDTKVLVPMTDANQNFSRVVRMVDENGMAVILKNNRPRYLVVDFAAYDEIKSSRAALIDETADKLIEKNSEAFKELAK